MSFVESRFARRDLFLHKIEVGFERKPLNLIKPGANEVFVSLSQHIRPQMLFSRTKEIAGTN